MAKETVDKCTNQNDLFGIVKKEITGELYTTLVEKIRLRKIRGLKNREKIIKKYPKQINLFR